jgi:ArsR family transcriptional regulator, arsenate/arsenite/antimonite-responsive transcriptional repressor
MNELATIFKALSDETRLRIIKLLEQGELCVCDIVAALDLIQPKVSFHLNVLKDAGLLKSRKEGKWMLYRFDDSDAFRRFLILAVLERLPGSNVAEDTARLKKWLQQKNRTTCCITIERRSKQ